MPKQKTEDTADLETTDAEAFEELPTTTITGQEQPRPQSERDILRDLPALDPEVPEKLHKQHAELAGRIETLLADESQRAEKVAEIACRAIDKPPTWKEREALEKAKIELLKRRAELCGALAEHAIDCGMETRTLRENLEPETAVQDRIAEKLRGIGFTLERRGPNGPFLDSRPNPPSGLTWNGIVRNHPEVLANVARRENLTGAAWQRFEQQARNAKTLAEQRAESERQRIMSVV